MTSQIIKKTWVAISFIAIIFIFIFILNSCINIYVTPEETVEENGSQKTTGAETTAGPAEATAKETTPPATDSREELIEDLIKVTNPLPNKLIGSPLTIEGESRGTWFFEATFPLRLQDADGNIIAEYYAQAEGEWMTEDFVPFTSELEFEKPETATGVLVLEKNNPSGLPEHDAELRIPVRFE